VARCGNQSDSDVDWTRLAACHRDPRAPTVPYSQGCPPKVDSNRHLRLGLVVRRAGLGTNVLAGYSEYSPCAHRATDGLGGWRLGRGDHDGGLWNGVFGRCRPKFTSLGNREFIGSPVSPGFGGISRFPIPRRFKLVGHPSRESGNGPGPFPDNLNGPDSAGTGNRGPGGGTPGISGSGRLSWHWGPDADSRGVGACLKPKLP
jgi:hypothetical protein